MRWVVITVAALLIGLLTYGVAAQGTDTTIESQLSKGNHPAAPEARLPTLGSNAPARLANFRGKIVLVNFWASWCTPCTQELPELQKVQTEMAAKGATVVGINVRDASPNALKFVHKNHLTYPSLRDGSGDYSDKWGVTAYPESYLLDRNGDILAAIHGPLDKQWIDANVVPAISKS